MEFDWQKYHSLALSWKSSSDEELKRCAISRSYYAFWHKLRKFKGIPGKRGQPHKIVRDKLENNYSDEQEIDLSYLLKGLQDLREDADYVTELHNVNSTLGDFFTRLQTAENLYTTITTP